MVLWVSNTHPPHNRCMSPQPKPWIERPCPNDAPFRDVTIIGNDVYVHGVDQLPPPPTGSNTNGNASSSGDIPAVYHHDNNPTNAPVEEDTPLVPHVSTFERHGQPVTHAPHIIIAPARPHHPPAHRVTKRNLQLRHCPTGPLAPLRWPLVAFCALPATASSPCSTTASAAGSSPTSQRRNAKAPCTTHGTRNRAARCLAPTRLPLLWHRTTATSSKGLQSSRAPRPYQLQTARIVANTCTRKAVQQ